MRSKGRPIEQDVELMLNNTVHNPFQVPISLHARSAWGLLGGSGYRKRKLTHARFIVSLKGQ